MALFPIHSFLLIWGSKVFQSRRGRDSMEAKFRSDLVFVSTSEVGVNTRNRLEAVHASVVDCFLSVGCSTWGNYRAPQLPLVWPKIMKSLEKFSEQFVLKSLKETVCYSVSLYQFTIVCTSMASRKSENRKPIWIRPPSTSRTALAGSVVALAP